MKKKLVTVLLASSMVATMLAGCGSGSGDGTEKGSSAKGGDGSVYMLNFKPETDQACVSNIINYCVLPPPKAYRHKASMPAHTPYTCCTGAPHSQVTANQLILHLFPLRAAVRSQDFQA